MIRYDWRYELSIRTSLLNEYQIITRQKAITAITVLGHVLKSKVFLKPRVNIRISKSTIHDPGTLRGGFKNTESTLIKYKIKFGDMVEKIRAQTKRADQLRRTGKTFISFFLLSTI